MSYKYIFEVKVFPGKEKEFIKHWHNGSIPIQTYPGALGTRLHKKRNEENVYIAIAEWESKEARRFAFSDLKRDGNPLKEKKEKWKRNAEFGEVTILAEVDEVSSVMPQ